MHPLSCFLGMKKEKKRFYTANECWSDKIASPCFNEIGDLDSIKKYCGNVLY